MNGAREPYRPASRHTIEASLALEHLTAFQVIVAAGSFSRAAGELRMSQSAVSQRVRHLEAVLGARLFDRQRGSAIRLTHAGQRLLQFADSVVHEFETLRTDLAAIVEPTAGAMTTVAAGPSFIKYRLLPVLDELRRAHPELAFSLRQAVYASDITAAVLSGAADLGIFLGPVPGVHLTSFALTVDHVVMVAAAGHEVSYVGKERRWDVLSRVPFAVSTKDAHSRQLADYWARTHGLDLKVLLETANLDTLKEAALKGIAIAILPEYALGEELKEGRLGMVPADGFPLQRRMSIVADARKPISAASRVLVLALREFCEEASHCRLAT